MKKRDNRGLSVETQAEIRIKAVEAVLKGESQKRVAELFGLNRTTVSDWMGHYRKGGKASLQAGQKGRPVGSGRRLSCQQGSWMQRKIKDKCPDQLKLPFVLWTREAVQQLIRQRFNICLSLWSVGAYLKQWGFTPQKPAKRAWQRDDAKVQHWMQTEYPKIAKKAKRQRGAIYWGDETGCRSDKVSGRSWSLKGQTPLVRISGNRFGCNVISAVTNQGSLCFKVFENGFVVAVFLEFLQRLIRHSKGKKVFLIVDGHPVHKAKAVRTFLAEHKNEIELFILPAYSPDLNPDEYLNHDLKANGFSQKRPANKSELMKLVRQLLYIRQKQPEKIKGYFHAPTVLYAA